MRYLRPELVLLFKAKAARPKDWADLRATLPRLEPRAVSWLHGRLAETLPGHPWLAETQRRTGAARPRT